MLTQSRMIGAAMLVAVAIPVGAQERGTIELGAFVSSTMFHDDFQMNNAIGFGGRVGAFLSPRFSVEFEANGGKATRPAGLADRSYTFIDGRLMFVPIRVGGASLLVGIGGGHVDANVDNGALEQSYGTHLLLGAKLPVTQNAAIRVDGVQYFHGDMTHRSLRAGLSLYRSPGTKETTVYQAPVAAMQRPDSVSAAETRRLRMVEQDYRRLRDSLAADSARRASGTGMTQGMTPGMPMQPNAAEVATMSQEVYFQRDQSDLSDSSRAILRDKVTVFRANPEMRIVITGYASSPGTEQYNMDLGMRRATAAKAYLVSQGVAENRIQIATRGEQNLAVEGPGDVANAANRRGEFRLLIAAPKQ